MEWGLFLMERKRWIWFILLIALPATMAFTQPLRLILRNNVDWDLALGVADITGLAGTDFDVDIESAANLQRLRIRNSTGDWRVDVSRADTAWHAGIRVYVQRTSDGLDGITISGGTTYQEITTSDTSFFTGTGNPRRIQLQFMTNGAFASAGVPSGLYSTTVTYTLTDNL